MVGETPHLYDLSVSSAEEMVLSVMTCTARAQSLPGP